MTTNLFVCHRYCKTILNLDSFRILLHFFRKSWDVGVLNSAIFNSFHNCVEFGMILEGFRNFGEGGIPPPPSVLYCLYLHTTNSAMYYNLG